MMGQIDFDENGSIEFEEFVNLVSKSTNFTKNDAEDEMLESFKMFDLNHDGFITKDEFKKVMLNLGEKLSDAEVDEYIKQYDINNDGKIDYKEFCVMMMSK